MQNLVLLQKTLFTKAIKSAPEEKSMLRDIYTWMQEHVPEFNDDHPHALNQAGMTILLVSKKFTKNFSQKL